MYYSILYLIILVVSAQNDEDASIRQRITNISSETLNIYRQLKTVKPWDTYMKTIDDNNLKIFLDGQKIQKATENERISAAEKLHNNKMKAMCRFHTFRDLTCALDFYKYKCTDIIKKIGVLYVNLLKTKGPKTFEWPKKVWKIRDENDHCWSPYKFRKPIYPPTSTATSSSLSTYHGGSNRKYTYHRNGKNEQNKLTPLGYDWEASDNITFYKWASFVMTDPEDIFFDVKRYGSTSIREQLFSYRDYARELQTSLQQYFNSLPYDQKEYKNLDHLKCTFAAIMVRNYRIACHFGHRLLADISTMKDRLNPDGTKPRLPDILRKLEHTWYFDEKCLNLPGILLPMIGNKDDFFYIGGNFTNALQQHVLIPALDGCPESNPPEEEIKKKIGKIDKMFTSTTTIPFTF